MSLQAIPKAAPNAGKPWRNDLILENEVDAMVGVYHSAVGLATMGIMEENEIPTVFSEPWNDNVSANGIREFDGAPPRFR